MAAADHLSAQAMVRIASVLLAAHVLLLRSAPQAVIARAFGSSRGVGCGCHTVAERRFV